MEGVGEWLKPPDCKSGALTGFAGSNPAPSTIFPTVIPVTLRHSGESRKSKPFRNHHADQITPK